MDKRVPRLLFWMTSIVALLSCSLPIIAMAADADSVTVFAAASTTNAVNDIGKMFAEKGMGKIVSSYASSSTLAKQIENGAPANVFISADEPWMNYLEERKLVEPGSRFDLLSNKLVLIAPSDRLNQQGGDRSKVRFGKAVGEQQAGHWRPRSCARRKVREGSA